MSKGPKILKTAAWKLKFVSKNKKIPNFEIQHICQIIVTMDISISENNEMSYQLVSR